MNLDLNLFFFFFFLNLILALVIEAKGWHTPFLGPTVIVPPQGIIGRLGEYTLQVPKPSM